MSKRLHRPRKRKGLSEMIGAVFILGLIGVSAGFALTMFTSFTNYQNAVDGRAQFNAQLPMEQLAYSKVSFGGSQLSTPTGGTSSLSSSPIPATYFPIANENFTTSSAGWTFTRRYLQVGVYGESGNFDPITSEGSSSGPGSVFTDFTFNQGSSTTVSAIGNWTAQFTLTTSQVTSLQSGSSTVAIRIADNLPAIYNVHASSGSPVVTAYLQNAATGYEIVLGSPTPPSNGVWTLFEYSLTGAQTQSFFSHPGTSGTYNFVLETQITLKGQASAASEQRVYFDDTGIKLTLANFYAAAACPTFLIPQDPLSVQDLTISVTTSYNPGPVTQTIYMWDYAQNSLTQVDVATIGSSSTDRFVDLGGLVGGASQVQGFIQSTSGTVNVPGCPAGQFPATIPKGTIIMEITAVGVGSFTGTLSSDVLDTIYTTTNQFSLQLTNTGSETIHLVSFWIIGSGGSTHLASTLTGASNFQQWVAPGQTVSFTVTYTWSPGQYMLELVSARGNIFTDSVTAS